MRSLATFDAIARSGPVQRFSQKKIDQQVLFKLLELANSARSDLDLQPWHFIVVRDDELKVLLAHVALERELIREAPVTIVLAADIDCWKTSYPLVLARAVKEGSLDEAEAAARENAIQGHFGVGPFGLVGLMKRLLTPLRRLRGPVAAPITSRAEAAQLVRSHTMTCAATLGIAAAGAGLAAEPITTFDEDRLKRLLALPSRMTVPVLIALGYPLEGAEPLAATRLPVLEKISVDLFPNMLSKLQKGSTPRS